MWHAAQMTIAFEASRATLAEHAEKLLGAVSFLVVEHILLDLTNYLTFCS